MSRIKILSLTHSSIQQMHNGLKESDPEIAQIMVCRLYGAISLTKAQFDQPKSAFTDRSCHL